MATGNRGNRRSPTPEERESIAERNRQRALRVRREQMQDLEWMASTGETTEGAAHRMGVTTEALWKRTDKAGRSDLWERLRTNEVVRFGMTLGDMARIARANAEKGTIRGPRKAA